MLRFTSLTIENFGPFKGTQTIDFTNRDGISIVWGNNGRGKTTLLNVFRYALFGKIQTRRGINEDLTSISNIESRTEGNYGFKVVLRMTNGDKRYELTRQYKVRSGVVKPVKNDDYEKTVFLKVDGSILSGEQCEHELNKIMPEQVSRFFLFDGELLQEYEELLLDDTSIGDQIKESIEKILGVPVLTNGALDIENTFDEYKAAKNRAAQNDNKTNQIAAQIAALEEKLKTHRSEYERLRQMLSEEVNKRNFLSDRLSQTERIRGLIALEKSLEDAIERNIERKKELLASINLITKEAWRGLVSERIQAVINKLDEKSKDLQEKEQRQHTANYFLDGMRQSIAKQHCQLCEQDINEEHLLRMREHLKQSEAGFNGLSSEEIADLNALRARKSILSSMIYLNNREKLEFYEDQLERINIDIRQDERKLKTVREDIERYGDIEGIEELTNQYAQSHAKVENYEAGKRDEAAKIAETQSSLATLDGQLNRNATGAAMLAAKRKVEICEQIQDIFEKGIDAYRDKLKTDVERDATDLFLKMSNDPDYIKLEINENYGLSIIHITGEKVPFRSAGFEHIVALSLIGALHKNAPLRGPIIMDSPFGRLDPAHKNNITKTLPSMSEQIVLLAYTHEIDEQTARINLGSSLNKEYRLTRQSSFFTRIE